MAEESQVKKLKSLSSIVSITEYCFSAKFFELFFFKELILLIIQTQAVDTECKLTLGCCLLLFIFDKI